MTIMDGILVCHVPFPSAYHLKKAFDDILPSELCLKVAEEHNQNPVDTFTALLVLSEKRAGEAEGRLNV